MQPNKDTKRFYLSANSSIIQLIMLSPIELCSIKTVQDEHVHICNFCMVKINVIDHVKEYVMVELMGRKIAIVMFDTITSNVCCTSNTFEFRGHIC